MEFFYTHVSPSAIEFATSVLKSGWLSEGKLVQRFEQQLADSLELANPVAVNSGTSALHLALAVAGVQPGDEVIMPAQTFVATALAALMQGAVPVFADINPKTGNISIESIREKMTPRTKALIPVHWAGYPCDMTEIASVAAEGNVTVIEDAAHALGATYQGVAIGRLSPFTCFSFQAIKHLTTGDGGAVACADPADAASARARRWFGIDRAASRPSILGEREYELTQVGYKYHLNDLAAAVGLGNLVDFPARLQRRRANAAFYRAELESVPGLELLECRNDRTHAYWLFTMLVDERERFIRALATESIPASVVHLRIDRHPLFGGLTDLPGQASFDARQVAIPVHENLTENDLERVVGVIRQGW